MSVTSNLYVVAAICGNFWQESTVNPGIWENLTVGAPGYGLGQWTDNAQVSRKTALFNYLDSHGYARDSGDGQLEFLVYENIWVPNAITPSAYNTLTDYFNSSSTNLSDLVYEFFYHWEGINDGTGPTRLSFATDTLNEFLTDDYIREPWYAGNQYNSHSRAIWNSLRIKDYLYGSTPPHPIPPHTRRRGLKPWFIDYIS